MKMKKILFVTNMFPTRKHPSFGIFIKEQIEALKMDYVCDEEVYLINGLHKSKLEYLKSIFSIPFLIKRYKPDIIHIHYGISGLFLFFFKPKVPVYLTLHGCDFQDHGNNKWHVMISKLIAKKVDQIFVQNEEMKKLGLKINSNTEILTCGVDTDFFNPEDANIESYEKKVIIFPSNPERKEKNYPLFLKVIAKVEEFLNEKIIIKCIANMSRVEIRDLLTSGDCLLMTSISEGSPQVVKEALSCGLPVVSVPVGNVKEMIEGVPNCKVSTSFDDLELSSLVIDCLKEKRDLIREKFMSKQIYSNSNIAGRLANFYQIPKRKSGSLNEINKS